MRCLVFALLLSLSTASLAAQPEFLSLDDLEGFKCPQPGPMVHPYNCHAIVYCSEAEEGEFLPMTAVQCPCGQSVSPKTLKCVSSKKIQPICTDERSTAKNETLISAGARSAVSEYAITTCPGYGTFCTSCNSIALCLRRGGTPLRTILCPFFRLVACNTGTGVGTAYCSKIYKDTGCPATSG